MHDGLTSVSVRYLGVWTSSYRPMRPGPPNKPGSDGTCGGRVPQDGGGTVGRSGALGSGGRNRPRT